MLTYANSPSIIILSVLHVYIYRNGILQVKTLKIHRHAYTMSGLHGVGVNKLSSTAGGLGQVVIHSTK